MTTVKNLASDPGRYWQEKFPNSKLFRDEMGKTYAEIQDVDGCWKAVPIKGPAIRKIIIRRYLALYGMPPDQKEIKQIIVVADACADICEKRHMHLRIARNDQRIYYSMGDDFANTVEISPGRWTVLQDPPVFFRKYSIGGQQILPTVEATTGLTQLFDYVNICDPGKRLLFQVYLISCFIPDIAHPAAMPFGPPGAAKSTFARVVKLLVDPSAADLVNFPANAGDLAQLFSHNYLCAFDNLTKISPKQSDMLCTAVTGGNFTKRTPFSEQEDTVFSFKGCMVLTGIHLLAEEPDLLDRSLLFELQKIEKSQRKPEEEFWTDFAKARPHILGCIFDTLAKALSIYPSINLAEAPRMADFYKWGIAITEAMGQDREDFIVALDANRAKVNQAVLDSNCLAETLIDFVRKEDKWEGTLTSLLKLLGRRDDSRQLPKAPNQLSRQLKAIAPILSESGVEVLWDRYPDKNIVKVILQRI